ncbi:MAG: magnesium-translocating P-type ATPase [Candidatus Micrarchaeota archaeon]|nr:magnesium-translocating P-type ATPase [Candidatus Micrarchaeota archaeon]
MKNTKLNVEKEKTESLQYSMPFWSIEKEKVISILNSSANGISNSEANQRILKYGRNEAAVREENVLLSLILRNLFNPITVALILAGLVTLFINDVQSAMIIFAIVFLSIAINVIQEYRSHNAIEKLKKMVTFYSHVVRDGEVVEIDSRDIVPGDIVLFTVGDRIPADLRIIEEDDLAIDESVITGEYYPVKKTSKEIKKKNILPQEMQNIAFAGSLVKEGKGKGIVIATGKNTFIGKTIGLMEEIKDESEFEKNMKDFSQYLLNIILFATTLILLMNIFVGHDIIISLIFAIALTVGLIPEPLPIIMTSILSRGAMKLASKGVIVKRLSATEDLGNVDILCCDKTGTLTENRLRVLDSFDYSGKESKLPLVLSAACVSVVKKDHSIKGNSIDVALVQHLTFNSDLKKAVDKYKIQEAVPFDYERQRMSVIAKIDRKKLLIVKGAPEAILSISRYGLQEGEAVTISKVRSQAMETYKKLSNQGLRVIAVGIKEIKKTTENHNYSKEDENEITFIGFVSFIDPIKPTAKETLKMAKKYGVEIKIITGDSAEVTRTITEKLEFPVEEKQILVGREIDEALRKKDFERLERTVIFARATPEQKYKIIKFLRSRGHVVAYLGDGVNDAPSLIEADVGISVNTGTDVSKEAADVILTRKSLKSVFDGIIIGRTLFSNIVKYLRVTFAGNFGNLFTIGFASGFLRFIPLLPAQILFINFLSDLPALAFSTDNVDGEDLKKPRKWRSDQIIKNGAIFGAISTVFDLILIVYLINVLGVFEEVFRTLFFLEIILSEIFVILFLRTTKPFFLAARPSAILMAALVISSAIGFISIFPPFASYLEFETPVTDLILFTVLIAIGYALTTELVKYFVYRNQDVKY